MSSGINKFMNRVAGNDSRIIDADFVVSDKGDLQELVGINVILRNITNLLLTSRGTYPFDPEYGCDLYKYLYEPADQITENDIKQEVEDSLRKYENRGNTTYTIVFDKTGKGFAIVVNVRYRNQRARKIIEITESLLDGR